MKDSFSKFKTSTQFVQRTMSRIISNLSFSNLSELKSESIFKRCPKYGKIVGLNTNHSMAWLLIPLIGIPALIWFLIRVIPKPDRLTYPCIQVAAPIAATFILWVAKFGLIAGGIVIIRRKVTSIYAIIALSVLLVVVAGTLSVEHLIASIKKTNYWDIPVPVFKEPSDVNQPIGTGKGIYPGRVSWAHNPAAVVWNGSGNWYADNAVNQEVVDNMFSKTILSIGGGETTGVAWSNIFHDFNKRKQKTTGYLQGEKIVIKINLNNSGGRNGNTDSSPHLVLSILKQLVNEAGVNAGNITVYDAQRGGMSMIKNYCEKHVNGVIFRDNVNVTWIPNAVKFSSSEVNVADAGDIPDFVRSADYMINMAVLKRHMRISNQWSDGTGQTAVTLCAKNHWGTIRRPWALHVTIRDWHPSRGMGAYNPGVDIIGSKYLGGNTLLYILDGLFTADIHNGKPKKWNLAPFNGQYPSSIFVSQDALAIESVGLDFLRAEWELPDNADNYLHEAALVENPPSDINYQPDGVPLTSLGVHEHWNNSTDKQYSRNLGTGNGIELYKVSTLPTSIKEVSVKSGVYPNPFSDYITFNSHYGTYRVLDLSGRVMQLGETKLGENTLSYPSLKAGIYLLHLTSIEDEKTIKIQKR